MFGLSPDGSGVYRMIDNDRWTHVGGAAGWLYGGPAGLFATNPATGDLYRWNSKESWSYAGSAGQDFAIGNGVYQLGRDGFVNQLTTTWNRIGGPAARIAAGAAGLVEIDPGTHDAYRYSGTPTWGRIFGPSATIAVGSNQIFSLSLDLSTVYQWTGGGTYIRIGGAFADIAAN